MFRAVVTTGIYCRPSCSAQPKPQNVREFAFAAAAEASGFRACHRCRPYRDASEPPPGSDLACRAVDLIAAGAMDESGEAALAARLAVSARHLRRIFVEQIGATPDQVARSRRATSRAGCSTTPTSRSPISRSPRALAASASSTA